MGNRMRERARVRRPRRCLSPKVARMQKLALQNGVCEFNRARSRSRTRARIKLRVLKYKEDGAVQKIKAKADKIQAFIHSIVDIKVTNN